MRQVSAGLLRVAAGVLAMGLLVPAASAQSTGKTVKFIP
jgi:hypothetical protein